jgi:hypothetical protein
MIEWALIAILKGDATVVAQVETEFECWKASAEMNRPELKGAQLGCYQLATELEKREQSR